MREDDHDCLLLTQNLTANKIVLLRKREKTSLTNTDGSTAKVSTRKQS